ncbi:CDP-diglyceride synthetase [Spongiibacter sp. IMCC21906]|uniref:phosphatidate cytidylyltransferase n=1 Tax=Spongiibacter sp. IMCC21906 TaxID=1620392 RepID=UPI00062DD84A|nr:phosphatidate cytidylyltransferase [Spongiibacter sp. IMCC21906]AKH70283.1 CDP-diglyceride synthetase [Spongiibacter sp. IMCC21906]
MLKQRVITAVLIVVALFAALAFLSASWLAAVFAVLILMAAWEWSDMSGFESRLGRGLFVAGCFTVMLALALNVALFSDVNPLKVRDVMVAACAWWAIALLWVKAYPASAGLWGSKTMRAFIGLLVLAPGWLSVSYLRFLEGGVWLILLVIALVAAADIGAYFVGRAWGKAKLAPSVSPGKSWAGFWGGLGSAMLLMTVLFVIFGEAMPAGFLSMLVLAGFTALASVLGDLLESMVKRHRGIKDSGQLLPGHGGLMDRIDSLTAAIPVFTLGLLSVGAA